MTFVQTQKPKVIFFYASWCGPSQAYRGVLELALSKYPNEFQPLEAVDIDREDEAYLKQFKILGCPTTILFSRYKKELGRLIGYNSLDYTLNFLRKGVYCP